MNQSAFVKERLISDNDVLGIEAFHSMKVGRPFLNKDFVAMK